LTLYSGRQDSWQAREGRGLVGAPPPQSSAGNNQETNPAARLKALLQYTLPTSAHWRLIDRSPCIVACWQIWGEIPISQVESPLGPLFVSSSERREQEKKTCTKRRVLYTDLPSSPASAMGSWDREGGLKSKLCSRSREGGYSLSFKWPHGDK
jgi:hypothetical protein